LTVQNTGKNFPLLCPFPKSRSNSDWIYPNSSEIKKDKEWAEMEIKINREIRDYTESMFFGLSLRQFVFALLAVGAAVGGYFLIRPHFGMETVSWVCVLGAAPFAAMGFIRCNGQTCERFLWAWLKSAFIVPQVLTFRASNLYYEALKPTLEGGKRT
jgi:hypothetical protein